MAKYSSYQHALLPLHNYTKQHMQGVAVAASDVVKPADVQGESGLAAETLPAMGTPVEEVWATGLLDDCDCGELCCNVFWCAPCMLGRIHATAVNNQPGKVDLRVCCIVPTAAALGEGIRWALLLTYGIGPDIGNLFSWVATSAFTEEHRTAIRKTYGIQGTSCNDCLTSWFCTGCAMCQHYRELAHRGNDPGLTIRCARQQEPVVHIVIAQPAYIPLVE
eukprot:TRINITY_DN8044_c2_g1_i1.p1 TRINITY_DN8044_c2_g1~~TRINITY_DN8044_c2_g1_i1.p1  ORF type:complete len:220 (+),score=24.63 TRINITY_DN8044_c2_g1_i1:22-681(+)